jgi:hypothetical protein
MNSIQTSWKTAVVPAGLLLSALLTACGDSTGPVDQSPTYLPGGDSNNTPDTTAPSDSGDGRPGEDPAAARDCVYVQWCDEPGPRGTICRLRSGCSYNRATRDECIRDTRAVCGTPKEPWYLY